MLNPKGNEEANQESIDSSTILRNLPFEEGFHFCTTKGIYLGVTATSLSDFASKLRDIENDSIVFHYYRGDFQRWINDALDDKGFADRLCFVPRGLRPEELRRELIILVEKRLNELERFNWAKQERAK